MRKHGSSDRVTLEKSEIERDLGVQVDKVLRSSQHIETQVNKANRLLDLIRRSYKHLDAESMKFTACSTCMAWFCSVVLWKKDKKLVEGVECRTSKIIPGLKDFIYEQRLEKMKLPSMCYRRLRDDLIGVFKCTYNIYKLSNSLIDLETRLSQAVWSRGM